MLHLPPLIRDLAMILLAAAAVTWLFRRIRQPVVLGYIIAGMLIGPPTDTRNVQTWADLGVIFVLFSVGLEFSFRRLARVGFSPIFTAIFEVSFVLTLGIIAGRSMGWGPLESVFLGSSLAISSTTIIIKSLEDLRLKTHRFAQVLLAVLIVEDLIAILILASLPGFAGEATLGSGGFAILTALAKLLLIVGSWLVCGLLVVPRLVRTMGRAGGDEMLVIVAVGLCLGLVVVAAEFHYSVALGAFIMGSIMAEAPESRKIEELIRPTRDIFAAVFFVSVGMLLDPRILAGNIWSVLFLAVLTLFGKVFATTLGALLSGQSLMTGLKVGAGLGQIGEFSFIIASLGKNLGVVGAKLYSFTVAVSLVTTVIAPYLIRSMSRSGSWVENHLPSDLKTFLNRYAGWINAIQQSRVQQSRLIRPLLKWLLNGLIVTGIFLAVGQYLLPLLEGQFTSELISGAIGLGLAILLSAIFVHGMISAFDSYRHSDVLFRDAVRVISFWLSGFWMSALSLQFLSRRTLLILVALVGLALFAFFFRQIESAYRWLEGRFMSTFDIRDDESQPESDELNALVPWDAHLVGLKVHPNSIYVGKLLREIPLRENHGVNVVVIQRGVRTIVSPGPDERVFPSDELLVLGTDREIEVARLLIENATEGPAHFGEPKKPLEAFEMRRVLINRNGKLSNETLRGSGIREEFGCIVVGIERKGERIISLRPDLVLEAGDQLWVVGEPERLQRLRKKAGS